ncbi:uncharacterized protein LOC120141519 isoform X2 [Hibiscus syriacus]|uniref:uncharacterized protein LOC120141519 isoform X2 n=1 Tax=Hibiscus syriacus TaxID=106335 RepID=UPI0019215A38|nr:uncharacterized protein LOC120141519 isoform X2 [Hibiscus syriacus]
MEVKLSHKRHFLLSKSPLSDHTKASFPPRTLQFKPWAAAEIQRFQGLVKVFLSLPAPPFPNGDYRTRQRTIPALMQGENLSSISKMYGVSVHSIAAANKNIMHIDLVFQGQLLNIPAPSLLDTELDRVKKNRLLHSIRALKAPSGKTLFTVLTSHRLSKAKSTGYFLVAVPLIAFCIGCVISTFLTRVSRGIRQQAVDKSLTLHHGAKGMRWKSALSDTVEGNVFDSKSGLDSIVQKMKHTSSMRRHLTIMVDLNMIIRNFFQNVALLILDIGGMLLLVPDWT